MGAAIGVSLSYEKQRRQLRQALIMDVIGNPKNQDVLQNIHALRQLLIQHDHICATAVREKANKFDHSATSAEAAFHELERLFTVYETSRVLKSAKMRTSPVACPLGHAATYFASMEEHPIAFSGEKGRDVKGKKIKPVTCGICEKNFTEGYHCGYCEYDVCKMCCTVYCERGHEMKLWTAGESDCSCTICNTHPIYSGYRCVECHDYDICDMCTYKDGRNQLAKRIMVQMEDNLDYMRRHMAESYTATHTITNLKVNIGAGEGAFPTIWHLVQFGNELQVLRRSAYLEVIQTRINTEIMRLRDILCIHPDVCATAAREVSIANKYRQPEALIADPFFTVKETSRLRSLVANHYRARSSLIREKGEVACPLGHQAFKLEDEETSSCNMLSACNKGIVKAHQVPPPLCKICDRLAVGGYHCTYCDYALCKTCKVVYCSEGHEMVMWTIPEAQGQRCYVCRKQEITQGYHCRKCRVNLCDMCTRKERRLNIRSRWDEELEDLMQYMHDQRYKSDIAKYFHWRTRTQVVSLGILCDTVRELRVAKYKAEKQVKFKPLIDRMKLLRADLGVNADISATAKYEAHRNSGHEGFFFKNKHEAKRELERLLSVVSEDKESRDEKWRQPVGIACPLGHGMCRLLDISLMPIREKEVAKVNDSSTSSDRRMDVGDAFASAFQEFNESSSMMTADTSLDDGDDSSSGGGDGGATLASGEEKSGGGLGAKKKSRRRKKDKVALPGMRQVGVKVQREVPLGSGCRQAWYEEVEDTSNGPVRVVYTDTGGYYCSCCEDSLAFGGFTCPMCEVHLCQSCSNIYCQEGHEMRIWTMLDAHEISCVLCNRQRLIMGYHCKHCNYDVCDRCTRKEAREGMIRWPRREVRKLLAYIESIKLESEVALSVYEEALEYIRIEEKASVGQVCSMLNRLRQAAKDAEAELAEKKALQDAHNYALVSTDF